MKKIFTLFAAVLMSGMAMAQVDETFVFVDADGNKVADGTTIVVNTVNDKRQMVIPLKVKKMTDADSFGGMWENIDAKPNGDWQTCAFGNCVPLSASGFSSKGQMNKDAVAAIDTEWMPAENGYATWEATLQIRVFEAKGSIFSPDTKTPGDEIAQGAKVTVRFEYSDPAGVNAVKVDGKAGKCYTLSGQLVEKPSRGLYIMDGRKVVIK